MTKKRSTKRALMLSALSLLMCVSMLVGSTFAWFTDSVTSGKNTIQSGKLDVELYYTTDAEEAAAAVKDINAWTKVTDTTDVFGYDRWEPGYTKVAYFMIVNEGNLALKYQLSADVYEEKSGVNQAGAEFLLSDYIKTALVDVDATRDEILAMEGTPLKASYIMSRNSLVAKDSAVVGLAIWMPTSVGNVANHNGVDIPEISFKINLFATQATYEEDSFGSDYDKGAPWTGMVDIDWYLENPDATVYTLKSAEELAGLAAIVNGTATAPATTYSARAAATIKDNFKGKTIKLGGNIDLNEIAWTPIGDNANPFLGNFDGQGNTVSNLYVVNEGWAGLIGHAGLGSAVTVKNVTIDGATILTNRMAGAVVGQIYGSIDNCHVKNATIMATPNLVGDEYDNGDKIGGIVGWLGDNGNNRTLTNCSATKVELGAYRDVGGIVGYVASSTTVSDNSASNIKITVDQTTNYYGDKAVNAGYICGRVNGTITEDNNQSSNSVVDSTYSKNGLTLKADGDGNVKLYLVPETYAAATVTVPEGITAIGNYAFAYNTNVETVVLSSTVRDLGRGFDSSTVKKVVLNEGLTTISSRAFKSTPNLQEVVISSTVTEIADNAFQKSAIKKIVIPASVKTIGETAFGASLIETVTFEGNTAIQGYAFRGCTKLRTVNLYGEDVTFVASTLNGRNSCWFCNGESNNPNTSNITFTVRSEEIKERVLTAMGAERNNTTVIVDDGLEKVESVDELKNTLAVNSTAGVQINATGVETSIRELGVAEGSYTTLKLYAGSKIKGATIAFHSNTPIMTMVGEQDQGEIVFENCTFTSADFSDSVYFQSGVNTSAVKLVFKNCTFAGAKVIFANNTGAGAEYINCKFNLNESGYGLVQCMGGNHTFTNCEFNISGSKSIGSSPITKYGKLNLYSERYNTVVTLRSCNSVSVHKYAAVSGYTCTVITE